MRNFLCRLAVYLLIFVFFIAAFNDWYKCGNYALADCAVQAATYYLLLFAFWGLIYELIFRLFRWERLRLQRRRAAKALAAQPLPNPNMLPADRATKHIENS